MCSDGWFALFAVCDEEKSLTNLVFDRQNYFAQTVESICRVNGVCKDFVDRSRLKQERVVLVGAPILVKQGDRFGFGGCVQDVFLPMKMSVLGFIQLIKL